MSTEEALVAVRAARGPNDIVVTTMSPAKVWVDLCGGPSGLNPLDFVFVPSCMSHATSVGLGLALAQPTRRVIVCNGDGSMLMNLGSLVTITTAAPDNLAVIVFDNGVYEVTGSQPTPGASAVRHSARELDWGAIAQSCGFGSVYHYSTAREWSANAGRALASPGPVFVALDI
ncbi:MAG: thiamine pyrophosphate-dependent enzyme, partial [Gemmatimonadota bacterium]